MFSFVGCMSVMQANSCTTCAEYFATVQCCRGQCTTCVLCHCQTVQWFR